ncbi:IS481 family transposase [Kingella potus]|uniref:IS481 family transposase n=1 Tax=Kingella potus TaxID=265175 RepID=UPI003CC80685
MPWRTTTMPEQRHEFVTLARKDDANISELCRRFAISRKTAYKWLPRDDMHDLSRRPHHSPKRTPLLLETQVLALRDRHPAWGGRKIAHLLQREQGIALAPSTITAILHRHQRITPQAGAAATPWLRFEHAYPNALWQMDFKGHFALMQGRCHPLTVLDDHSRYNIVLQALDNERRATVQNVLHAAFCRYGLPERINVDNGAPWGGQGGLTALAVWLIRLGIRLTYSRPAHPQTNGKDEHFHRTLKAEVLQTHTFADLAHVQSHFEHWRHIYNHQLPHEALNMDSPAQRYRVSARTMPSVLPEIEYLEGDIVLKVQQGGWLSLKGREIRVGKALVGQRVALRAEDGVDGRLVLYFCHHRLGEIDLDDC